MLENAHMFMMAKIHHAQLIEEARLLRGQGDSTGKDLMAEAVRRFRQAWTILVHGNLGGNSHLEREVGTDHSPLQLSTGELREKQTGRRGIPA